MEEKLKEDVWIMVLNGDVEMASKSLGEVWAKRSELMEKEGHLSAEIEIFRVTKVVRAF